MKASLKPCDDAAPLLCTQLPGALCYIPVIASLTTDNPTDLRLVHFSSKDPREDNHYQKKVFIAVILALVAAIAMAVSAIYAWTFSRKAREDLDSKDTKISSEMLLRGTHCYLCWKN